MQRSRLFLILIGLSIVLACRTAEVLSPQPGEIPSVSEPSPTPKVARPVPSNTPEPTATLTTTSAPSVTLTATRQPPTRPSSPLPPPTSSATLTLVPTVSGPDCTRPPVIESFSATSTTVGNGQATTLNWGRVENAQRANILPGIGGVGTPGSATVSPTQTTTYVLTAVGCGGTATKQVTITVIGGPVVSPTAPNGSPPSTTPTGGAPTAPPPTQVPSPVGGTPTAPPPPPP